MQLRVDLQVRFEGSLVSLSLLRREARTVVGGKLLDRVITQQQVVVVDAHCTKQVNKDKARHRQRQTQVGCGAWMIAAEKVQTGFLC
jgi:hypothetical protein